MDAVILIGIQAVGKSTFYKERFFTTHVRINLDMLKTRHRESLLLRACLDGKQSFVVDNTNVTIAERAKYVTAAKDAGFRVIGYFFRSNLKDALERNGNRLGTQSIPDMGVLSKYKRLQVPTLSEGFDRIYLVAIGEQGEFMVEEWVDEV